MKKIIKFEYTGDVQKFVVPNFSPYIDIKAYGSKGADYAGKLGGNGGYAYGRYVFKETDNRELNIYCGSSTGWNGGGLVNILTTPIAAGGGASDIRINGTEYSNRIITAAGGGGAGYNFNGGDGGGLEGVNSNNVTPGTQTSAGRGYFNGGFGYGAMGIENYGVYCGGGGAGWYGGGGGNGTRCGGAGGSSHIAYLEEGTNGTETGVNNGNGYIIISYNIGLSFILKNQDLYITEDNNIKFICNKNKLTQNLLKNHGLEVSQIEFETINYRLKKYKICTISLE